MATTPFSCVSVRLIKLLIIDADTTLMLPPQAHNGTTDLAWP